MFQPIRMDHVIVSSYSTNVSWSCDQSRLSIHVMWSIPQSCDVKGRKLKAINTTSVTLPCRPPWMHICLQRRCAKRFKYLSTGLHFHLGIWPSAAVMHNLDTHDKSGTGRGLGCQALTHLPIFQKDKVWHAMRYYSSPFFLPVVPSPVWALFSWRSRWAHYLIFFLHVFGFLPQLVRPPDSFTSPIRIPRPRC